MNLKETCRNLGLSLRASFCLPKFSERLKSYSRNLVAIASGTGIGHNGSTSHSHYRPFSTPVTLNEH